MAVSFCPTSLGSAHHQQHKNQIIISFHRFPFVSSAFTVSASSQPSGQVLFSPEIPSEYFLLFFFLSQSQPSRCSSPAALLSSPASGPPPAPGGRGRAGATRAR